MYDLLLEADGDLNVASGDIAITGSIRQAIRIRLLWFFREWRFAPDSGVPYYESIFVKNPDKELIRRIVRDQVLSVDGVSDISNITVDVAAGRRQCRIEFMAVTEDGTFGEVVELDV